MPQATEPSQVHTGSEEIIVGVDTHKDVHVAAVISVLGVLLGTARFPTTAAGYRQLLSWARGLGTLRRAGVEYTGSYGAALTRYLLAAGLEVVEVNNRTRPAVADEARPTPSMPKPPLGRCCPVKPRR
jgi:transposase